jgi:hypothetical protein
MSTTPSLTMLTSAQTATLIGVRPSTLEIWRIQGKGPAYLKIGRLVRYIEIDVVNWLREQARSSTSQYAPHRHR